MKQEGTIRLEKMSLQEENILWCCGACVLALPNTLVDKFLKKLLTLISWCLKLHQWGQTGYYSHRHDLQLLSTWTGFLWAVPVQGKTVQSQLWVLLGSLHDKSSSGCKDPGHGLSIAASLELPRGRGENLPPTRLLCCIAGTQRRVKQGKQGSWSGCIHRSASIYVSCFCQKGQHKTATS